MAETQAGLVVRDPRFARRASIHGRIAGPDRPCAAQGRRRRGAGLGRWNRRLGPGDVGLAMWGWRCGAGDVGLAMWGRRCGAGDVGPGMWGRFELRVTQPKGRLAMTPLSGLGAGAGLRVVCDLRG